MFISIIFSVVFIPTSYGQGWDTGMYDSLFNVLDKNNVIMGGVEIRKGGKCVYNSSYGYQDVELQVPSDSLSRYAVGSISKTISMVNPSYIP